MRKNHFFIFYLRCFSAQISKAWQEPCQDNGRRFFPHALLYSWFSYHCRGLLIRNFSVYLLRLRKLLPYMHKDRHAGVEPAFLSDAAEPEYYHSIPCISGCFNRADTLHGTPRWSRRSPFFRRCSLGTFYRDLCRRDSRRNSFHSRPRRSPATGGWFLPFLFVSYLWSKSSQFTRLSVLYTLS